MANSGEHHDSKEMTSSKSPTPSIGKFASVQAAARKLADEAAKKAADDASHETYNKAMSQAYEDLEAEHAAAMAAKDVECARQIAKLKEDQRAVVAEKEAELSKYRYLPIYELPVEDIKEDAGNAGRESVVKTTNLEGEIARLKERNKAIERQLGCNRRINRILMGKVRRISDRFARGFNTWTEVHFKAKGFKTRTYYRRLNAKFDDAVSELLGEIGAAAFSDVQFEYQGEKLVGHTTLDDIGIVDGAEVWYSKIKATATKNPTTESSVQGNKL